MQRIVLTKRGDDKFREALTHWRRAQETFVSLYGEAWSETLRAAVRRIAYDDRLVPMTEDRA